MLCFDCLISWKHVSSCFVLFCFVLFCFVLFCFVLFCFIIPYFMQNHNISWYNISYQNIIWHDLFVFSLYSLHHLLIEESSKYEQVRLSSWLRVNLPDIHRASVRLFVAYVNWSVPHSLLQPWRHLPLYAIYRMEQWELLWWYNW